MSCLEDYCFILRDSPNRLADHAGSRELCDTIRFTGRTIAEFKAQVFSKHYLNTNRLKELANVNAEHTLTDKDLYVLYREEILGDDFEIEYCLNTHLEPLIVYVPADIDYAEFKL
jgi:hypothetical protein